MLNVKPFHTAGKVHIVRFFLSYCANILSDCQCTDWPSHKRICKTLAEGNWIDICFDNPGYEPLAPNTHGNRPFLIKILASSESPSESPYEVNGSSAAVSIYDKGKTLTVIVLQESDPQQYELLITATRSTSHFRWAKRTCDWQMSICIDREPEDDPTW